MTAGLAVAITGGALLGAGVLVGVLYVLGSPPGRRAAAAGGAGRTRWSGPSGWAARAGWAGTADRHGEPEHAPGGPLDLRSAGARAGIGVGVGLLVLVLSRWIVLAVAIGGLAAGWRRIFGGAAEERAGIRRLDALASWTESLRDTIAGAAGLEQAIPATSATAAAALRPALTRLVDRLRVRETLPAALLRFADELGDPSADLIVSSLVLNARLRGPGLRDVLGALATSAREELDMRRRIESSRRSTRRSVQIVVAVTLGVAALMILLNRTYVRPYGTVVGQLVLTVVIALFAAGVVWLRRLARIEMPGRFLIGPPSASGGGGGAGGAGGAAGGAGTRLARYAATPTSAAAPAAGPSAAYPGRSGPDGAGGGTGARPNGWAPDGWRPGGAPR